MHAIFFADTSNSSSLTYMIIVPTTPIAKISTITILRGTLLRWEVMQQARFAVD
jgi:hypothetical protein